MWFNHYHGVCLKISKLIIVIIAELTPMMTKMIQRWRWREDTKRSNKGQFRTKMPCLQTRRGNGDGGWSGDRKNWMESEFVFTQNNSPGHPRGAFIIFFWFADQLGNSSLCFFAPAQTLTWPQHIYHKVDTSMSVPLCLSLFYCNVMTLLPSK